NNIKTKINNIVTFYTPYFSHFYTPSKLLGFAFFKKAIVNNLFTITTLLIYNCQK
ncbi:MAG: hypothetical protein JWQ06_1312, partial [Mucilaginibacter sp.]|nr:hypothetical protein [Mucilaginibacter sp.]